MDRDPVSADPDVASALRDELDAGEAEAIALALQAHADLILMDERRGRAVAQRLGLRRIGLVGVVLALKQRGLIQAARPLLDALVARAGLWVGADVYREAVIAAGESDVPP